MSPIRDLCDGTRARKRGRYLTSRTTRRIAAFLLFATMLARYPIAHAGDLDRVVLFDIQAQTLQSALVQFGVQAHVQLSVPVNAEMRRLRAPLIRGSYTSRQALTRLLSGTGLRFVTHNQTVEVLPRNLPDPAPPTQNAKPLSSKNRSRTAHNVAAIDPPIANRNSSSNGPREELHEVVVTAQLYRQPTFDVPIDLDVVTAKELYDWRTLDLTALQYQVPGVYIQTGAGVNRITIDGVGSGVGSGALVGEYVDEADVTGGGNTGGVGVGTGDVGLYDVSRVEVLHGPQGTLYGDGSMGGVIRVITNRPDLYELQFGSDVAALYSQYGAPSQQIHTMLNMPFVAGTLGLRLAGDIEHDGGWIDEPEANAKNINGSTLSDVRLEVLWQPSARLNVYAMQIIRRDAFGVGYGEDAQGNVAAPLPFGLTTTPQAEHGLTLSNLTLSYSSPIVRVLNSATYFTNGLNWDNLFVTSPYVSTSFSEYVLYRQQAYSSTDYSEELRLSNATHGPWQWMVGGFYKHYADKEYQNASLTYSMPAAPLINFSLAGLDTASNSTAAFVNTSYRFSPRLEIGAGARYYSAHNTYNEPTENYHGYAGLGVIPGKFEGGHFLSTDPRFYVRYGLTSHVNIYGTAAKGFREGGFNGPGLPNYQPETLWRYDVGMKSRFLDNELQSDLDLFYSDYSKYVVEGFFPAVNNYYLGNAGTAHIKGFNANVKWRLSKDWFLGVAGECVDAKFVSIAALDTGLTVGDQVPLVTKYSVAGSIERDFQWHEKQGDAVLSYSEISGVQYNVTGYIYSIAQSNVLRLLNFTGSIELSNSLRVGLFAHNLLNDRGYLSPFWIYGEASRSQPRTFGVDFRVDFGGHD